MAIGKSVLMETGLEPIKCKSKSVERKKMIVQKFPFIKSDTHFLARERFTTTWTAGGQPRCNACPYTEAKTFLDYLIVLLSHSLL
jgi:hypothetical protein